MAAETVQIDYLDLKSKIDAGWKKDALVKHYGLNNNQMSNVLKDCGLKIKRTRKQAPYKIVGLPTEDNNGPGPIESSKNIQEEETTDTLEENQEETTAPDTEVTSDTKEEVEEEAAKSEW